MIEMSERGGCMKKLCEYIFGIDDVEDVGMLFRERCMDEFSVQTIEKEMTYETYSKSE